MGLHTFDAPDADVILLSGEEHNSTEFRVHRCILAAASPFFYDMFTLPQNQSQDDSKLPIIPVSEHAGILDSLLRFIYPVQHPYIDTLDQLVPILTAAVKYDLMAALISLRALLVSPRFAQAEPTRVYAIASRFEFEEEAQIASKYTLSVNVLDAPLSDDLKFISAYAYHRLLDLHRRRVQAALQMLKPSDDVKCMQCNGSAFSVYFTPKWWSEFEKNARAELSVRPTTDVIFGMEFLAQAAISSGCQRCAGSVLDSWKFLQELKRNIDELPATI
jgi:BTB/POZ domain